MPAVADGVLLYATDPAPSGSELVFDFVQGQIVSAVTLPAGATNATAGVATATGAANSATTLIAVGADGRTSTGAALDATTTTDGEPEPEPPAVTTRAPKLPTPRTTAGRTVRLTLTADLGALTAHTTSRIELADEELIEIL